MPSGDIDEAVSAGGETRVFTWLAHTDKDMRLFGFADERRRATFLELQKVEGIGPKAALRIMGGISQTELERALTAGDLERLERVPGLGKKTAQKMVLALKGKLVQGRGEAAAPSRFAELASALIDMGYDRKTALAAIEKAEQAVAANAAAPLSEAQTEAEVFRLAILGLNK